MTAPYSVLAARDVNTSTSPSKVLKARPIGENEVMSEKPKTMEYHRQVLKSKMEEDEGKKTYVSPSDTIMSPCTAKLSAHKSKHFMKAKPQSLFAKTSNKNLSFAATNSVNRTGDTKQESDITESKNEMDA